MPHRSSPPADERPAGNSSRDERPNIVVILADDLGYRDVGYNGGAAPTPNIDRLARDGVVFSDGYVTSPVCSPSRAALLTGRYQARFGLEDTLAYAPMDSRHGLPTQETTLASRLRGAGYRTAMIGKWHLGSAPLFHPLRRGFDTFYGMLHGGHDYFAIDATTGDEYFLPLGQDRGAAGFEGYLTDALTDRAVAFIKENAGRRWRRPRGGGAKPFFLYLAYNAPHVPLQAEARLVEKYAHVADDSERTYYAMIASLDANVGRILKALRRRRARQNTVIFFLSDNGGVWPWREGLAHYTWANNAPLRGGKTSLYEGGIRVPFVASWPAAWPRGETHARPVISLDIAATAVALAGAADPSGALDGDNLDPVLRGERAAPPRALFWRQERGELSSYAVRLGEWKLVKASETEEVALFNLRADVGETRNVIGENHAAAKVLADRWHDWNDDNQPSRFLSSGAYATALQKAMAEMADTMRRRAAQMAPLRIGLPGEPDQGPLPELNGEAEQVGGQRP